ncbi:polysaccharide deacetylase [Thiohalorhabdus denitrificans]|uniref:Polysaccharide deacetylase family protein, PEP-CTERM locus subfamily n=1 Tax=Thiohalorhabdus denitrificans TaxID=381306 RepID=A0A0P9C594_9GAMM|nr:XrtA system polysaccharide deacetylase [Thiohalorhabdus denitrificans]KPV40019.1 polysaccharide deacetylase [Thiohalorhabdus denitrificans]SCY12291.1 polysaccharide deacetylase family protein, PEP-CTERM locus subfamily [Thiohalorhabdus denitrificans]
MEDSGPISNALSVDVEDYFQVSAFAGHIDRADWDRLPHRVERNTDRILQLFADHGARATFFVLGWVADRYPDLVRRLADNGHEVASHGYGHIRVDEQSPEEFRADVQRAKALLEDTSGQAVRGYRAASFSIGRDSTWAFDVLREEGHRYSSSVNPIRHDLYGMPEAPRFAHAPAGGDLIEVPVSTVEAGGRNLPCGGGGFFRLLPYAYFRWGLRRINRREGRPAVFYFHPWEIDPEQPRQRGVALRTRFRHYVNLHRTEPRLRRLLDDFRWERMDRIFLEEEQA